MKQKLDFLRSLRLRILFLTLFAGILPGAVVAAVFFHFYEKRSISSDVVSITAEAQLLGNQMITSGYFDRPGIDEIDAQLSALGNVFSGRVMVMDSSLRVVEDTYDMYEGKTVVWENVVQGIRGTRMTFHDKDSHYLVVTVPITESERDEPEGVLLVTRSTEYLEQNARFFRNLVVYAILVTLIFSSILAVLGSDSLTHPLRRLSAVLSDYEQEKMTTDIRVNDVTETADISSKLNNIIGRMKEIDASRQEFVSNVSHELKTPLTSMKVLADSLTAMGEAPVELYQEFMSDIVSEIDRETKIVNDLLSLVRMDKAEALNISPLKMNELLELILKRLRPIAEKQEVELVMESFRPVTVEVDEVKFSLAVTNLIENGIKYNEPGGYVRVALNSDHQYCYIRVQDTGMGIPQDELGRVFERFYRVDKSHSRTIEGTGLGLAITKNAVDLHHGEISVHSTLGEGTTFDVRIPLKYTGEA